MLLFMFAEVMLLLYVIFGEYLIWLCLVCNDGLGWFRMMAQGKQSFFVVSAVLAVLLIWLYR
jgi:hypothetical protein